MEKTSKESFKAYRDWQRHILNSKPKLSKGCRRATLIAYCLTMASHGTNGIGCFASDATVAIEIGLNQAKLARAYRNEALRLGWFALAGKKGRVNVLDISIPEDIEIVPEEHDRSVPPGACAACRPAIAKVYAQEMSKDDVFALHYGDDDDA